MRAPEDGGKEGKKGKRGGGGGGGNVDLEAWGNRGTIKDMKSGFGFIRPHGGQVEGRDLYFHATGCAKGVSYNELHVNDEVTYEVGQDERKRNQTTAKNVRPVNGGGGGGAGSRSRSRSRSGGR